MPTFEERFRAVATWCAANGVSAGFPTCHENTSVTPALYGTILINQGATWQDVPRATLGNASTPRTRLTNAHDWARTQQGVVHGFPTFHEANYGAGVVHGTYLLTAAAVTWQDVPVASILGANVDPTGRPMEDWFRGAHDWAVMNGRAGAMPNGHYAQYNGTWVVGIFSLNPGAGQFRDLSADELGFRKQYQVGGSW